MPPRALRTLFGIVPNIGIQHDQGLNQWIYLTIHPGHKRSQGYSLVGESLWNHRLVP